MTGKPVTPLVACDALIEIGNRVLLIERRNPPHGLAVPGGYMDIGESAEQCAIREAREETGLDVELLALLGVYSDPRRDPRGQVITMVYVARSAGQPVAGDDAGAIVMVDPANPPPGLAFDHRRVLYDYVCYRRGEGPPAPALMLDRLRRPITQP
ncbi:MAG: NUDIX hydrolase [Leptospirales bacterium]|nr:NUDIX hydrolase [Leptospirales bacterium]